MWWLIIPGFLFYGLGTFLTCINFDLAFLRYRRHRRRGGTDEGFKYVSGIPLFGSVFLYIAAGLLYWEYPVIAGAAICMSLFDPWGIPSAVVICIWDFVLKPVICKHKSNDQDKI
jgi:hypothetical protein